MYTQRIPELHEDIQTDGCALHSAAFAVTVYHPDGVFFTPDDENGIYEMALDEGAMKEGCYVEDWEHVFDLLGLEVEYLGHKDKDWSPGENEFEIVQWTLTIPHEDIDWQHFTFGGDESSQQFFDPWGSSDPGYHTSRCVAEGVIDSKRGFRIREEGWG